MRKSMLGVLKVSNMVWLTLKLLGRDARQTKGFLHSTSGLQDGNSTSAWDDDGTAPRSRVNGLVLSWDSELPRVCLNLLDRF